MFDVFQNVLFGKKKSNAEAEKEKPPDTDEFVLLGGPTNEQASAKEVEPKTNELFPKNPYAGLLNSFPPPIKSEETSSVIMPLQGVPFIINPNLHASEKLENIWRAISPCISYINNMTPYKEEYDFSLEKSVIAETTTK